MQMSSQATTRIVTPVKRALNTQRISQTFNRTKTPVRGIVTQWTKLNTTRASNLSFTNTPTSVPKPLNIKSSPLLNHKANFTTTSSSLSSVQDIATEDDLNLALTDAGDSLVVVDFYATWCGPCKVVAPMMDRLSQEYNEVVFLKVDVDSAPQLAAVYGITSMPTIVYIKNGRMLAKVIGANLAAIREGIEAND